MQDTDNPVHRVWIPDNVGRVEIEPGDLFEFDRPMSFRDGTTVYRGARLLVLDRTEKTPYAEVGPYGHNWVCETLNGSTVWATLEQCVALGLLRRVQRGHKHQDRKVCPECQPPYIRSFAVRAEYELGAKGLTGEERVDAIQKAIVEGLEWVAKR